MQNRALVTAPDLLTVPHLSRCFLLLSLHCCSIHPWGSHLQGPMITPSTGTCPPSRRGVSLTPPLFPGLHTSTVSPSQTGGSQTPSCHCSGGPGRRDDWSRPRHCWARTQSRVPTSDTSRPSLGPCIILPSLHPAFSAVTPHVQPKAWHIVGAHLILADLLADEANLMGALLPLM